MFTKGAPMLANPPLQEAVIATLESDPRIPEPLTIAVAAHGNVVTLRGVVETFRQRHAAIDDVRQVDGVREIDDQLHVRLRPMDHRADDEIRAAALQTLMRDAEVPAESIEVSVRDGWVTLTGYVEYEPQRVAAYDHVATLDGVTGISNEIELLGF
jgi:osmotically-inducible protein OsmY